MRVVETRTVEKPPAPTVKKRVFLVDDHLVVRVGLRQLIGQTGDLEVCGEAEGVGSALAALVAARADIVLVDISLRGESGLTLVQALSERSPGLPTVVLSIHDEGFYVEQAFRAGARGYVVKEEAIDQVLTAIRRVLAGNVYVGEQIASQLRNSVLQGRLRGRWTDESECSCEMIGREGTMAGAGGIVPCLAAGRAIDLNEAGSQWQFQVRRLEASVLAAIQWIQARLTG
jgi:DNA-binding NarL/FixJ family response regulator